MKAFSIMGTDSARSALELLNENDDGYYVRIVHQRDGWEDVTDEFITRELFDTCIRTGYISEMTA